jgi:hypothetical protein
MGDARREDVGEITRVASAATRGWATGQWATGAILTLVSGQAAALRVVAATILDLTARQWRELGGLATDSERTCHRRWWGNLPPLHSESLLLTVWKGLRLLLREGLPPPLWQDGDADSARGEGFDDSSVLFWSDRRRPQSSSIPAVAQRTMSSAAPPGRAVERSHDCRTPDARVLERSPGWRPLQRGVRRQVNLVRRGLVAVVEACRGRPRCRDFLAVCE